MAFTLLMLPIQILSILASFLPQSISALPQQPTGLKLESVICEQAIPFDNYIVRAPNTYENTHTVNPAFTEKHLLFIYTDRNTALSQAAFASFCLDQCINYQPRFNYLTVINPPSLSIDPDPTAPQPDAFVNTERNGPCLGFVVDLGRPFPYTEDTVNRWFCRGFNALFELDQSDFVPIEARYSFLNTVAVNRNCGGGYRAY